MRNRDRLRAARLVVGALCMSSAACAFVEGLNHLEPFDCVGTCDDGGNAGDGASSAPPDTGLAPADAPSDVEIDGTAPADSSLESGVSEASSDASVDVAVDGSTQPIYLGCFRDSNPNRDLPFQVQNDGTNNTNAGCIAACAGLGYTYSATQNGNECYCGNGYGGYGPTDGCNTACTGAPSQTCGGPYANSVYVAIGSAPPPPVYVGCYGDGTPRDLPEMEYSNSFGTTETCVAACTYHGYLFAGAQYGGQCFCGNSYGIYGTSHDCTYVCTGNAFETCGGLTTNSIYKTRNTTAFSDAGDASGD